MKYITGNKPGKGTYKCNHCGTMVKLDKAEEALPPCPKCHNIEYTKIN